MLVSLLLSWLSLLSSTGGEVDSLKNLLSRQEGTERISTLNELSWYYKAKNLDSAQYFAREALHIALKTNSETGISAAYNSLGNVMEARGQVDSALYYHQQALAIHKRLKDTLGIASSLNNLGILYDETGQYATSLAHYFEALGYYESLDNVEEVAMVLINIGIVYKKQQEFEKVLSYYHRALKIYQQTGSLFGQTVIRGNIGSVFNNLGQYDSSLYYSEAALDGYSQLGFVRYLPYIHQNMAIAYDSLGDYASARDLYLQSINGHRQFANNFELANVSLSLGNSYYRQGDFARARQTALTGIQYAKKAAANEYLTQLHALLARSLSALGRYREALHAYEQYISGKDSLYRKEKLKQIFELETQYETEKKEQQIALQQALLAEEKARNQVSLFIIAGLMILVLLSLIILYLVKSRTKKKELLLRQQSELMLKEAQIEASIHSQEKERARYAKDLHDGFGQLISVLNLNLKRLEDPSADRHRIFENCTEVLDEMYREIKAVCFDLMPQTLITHGLALAVREFAARINKSGQVNVEVDLFGMEKRLDEVREVSLYRIIQEWVNNILKYGKASHITIQLTRERDDLTLLIEDDGPGFDRSLLEQSKGHGWHNIQSRVNLIRGQLDLDTVPDRRGNSLIVDCPASTPMTFRPAPALTPKSRE